MDPADILAYRQRAASQTSFESKHGYHARRAVIKNPAPRAMPYCAPTPQPCGNAKANGFKRHYSYSTAADTFGSGGQY
jgi:hypothetical protein